jgi:hypothetical protein
VQQGLTRLRRLALVTRPSDRVFVHLAGHGATGRPLTDTSRETSATHILQFGDGSIVRYDQFTPSFRRIAASGAELSVLDGNCDGGEAVMDAIGQRYLALSTTAIHAPGITNTPNPGDLMSRAGKPNSFGLARTDEVGRVEGQAQDVAHAWHESDERVRGPEPHGLGQTRYDRLFANELRVIAGSAIIAALHRNATVRDDDRPALLSRHGGCVPDCGRRGVRQVDHHVLLQGGPDQVFSGRGQSRLRLGTALAGCRVRIVEAMGRRDHPEALRPEPILRRGIQIGQSV